LMKKVKEDNQALTLHVEKNNPYVCYYLEHNFDIIGENTAGTKYQMRWDSMPGR
jgi:hypothetical protein